MSLPRSQRIPRFANAHRQLFPDGFPSLMQPLKRRFQEDSREKTNFKKFSLHPGKNL